LIVHCWPLHSPVIGASGTPAAHVCDVSPPPLPVTAPPQPAHSRLLQISAAVFDRIITMRAVRDKLVLINASIRQVYLIYVVGCRWQTTTQLIYKMPQLSKLFH